MIRAIFYGNAIVTLRRGDGGEKFKAEQNRENERDLTARGMLIKAEEFAVQVGCEIPKAERVDRVYPRPMSDRSRPREFLFR